MKLLQRSKIVPQPNGCHLWTGAKTGGGYGRIARVVGGRTRTYLAHRLAWEEDRGEAIPAGLLVLHTCDVPACVNPEHLYVGTHKQNTQDLVARGRGTKTRQRTLRTACSRGHEYTAETTYVMPSNPKQRICRICQSAGAHKRYAERRAKRLRSTPSALNFLL